MPPAEIAKSEDGGLFSTARALLSAVVYPHVEDKASIDPDAAASITINQTAGALAHGQSAGFGALATQLTAYVVLPLLVGAGLLALVLQNGKYLVNKPQLCPQLAVTVQRPSKQTPKKTA
jgi:hypothetical protein